MVCVCAMLINKLKCETIPEGEIFPYLLGDFTAPNYKISRLDASYSLNQITGSNNFKNVYGAPVQIKIDLMNSATLMLGKIFSD